MQKHNFGRWMCKFRIGLKQGKYWSLVGFLGQKRQQTEWMCRFNAWVRRCKFQMHGNKAEVNLEEVLIMREVVLIF